MCECCWDDECRGCGPGTGWMHTVTHYEEQMPECRDLRWSCYYCGVTHGLKWYELSGKYVCDSCMPKHNEMFHACINCTGTDYGGAYGECDGSKGVESMTGGSSREGEDDRGGYDYDNSWYKEIPTPEQVENKRKQLLQPKIDALRKMIIDHLLKGNKCALEISADAYDAMQCLIPEITNKGWKVSTDSGRCGDGCLYSFKEREIYHPDQRGC